MPLAALAGALALASGAAAAAPAPADAARPPAASPGASGGCLPDGDGFLTMRLRGSIEQEIDWRGAALRCTGMARPDGNGLRLRFAGQLAGTGELVIVFAAAGLGPGAAARDLPVNVTLLDRGGERIYATRGDQRCTLDRVRQQPLPDAAAAPRYRVSARGFCTEPARAQDGAGTVLLTRFDFAGLVTLGDESPDPSTATGS